MDQASTDAVQDDSNSTDGVQMGVELTATAVHPDTAVLIQVLSAAYRFRIVEFPKSSWLLMPISGGGTPPTSVQPSVLPETAKPVEDIVKNLDVTADNNCLTSDLNEEVIFQPSSVTEPPEVLEKNESMTVKSKEMQRR